MSLNDAKNWILENCETESIDGEQVVVVYHSDSRKEMHAVSDLAERYEDEILNGNPKQAAKEADTGHERFFD